MTLALFLIVETALARPAFCAIRIGALGKLLIYNLRNCDGQLKQMINWLSGFFFGKTDFPGSEEFREFQHKFLILLQIFGCVTSGLYVFLGNAGSLGATDETSMPINQ